MSSEQQPVQAEPEKPSYTGRTIYDSLSSFGRWLKDVGKKILLVLVIVLAWWIVGWYAAASLVAGAIVWYVVLDRYVNDQGAVLLDAVHDGVWSTWAIGQDAWSKYRIKGIPFAFRSSEGQPRYLAEEFSPSDGRIKFAWIHQLSTWKFFMSFRAHRSLLNVLEKTLPENIRLRMYPRILGYREAAAAMKPIGNILDEDMLTADVDSDLWIKERESIDQFFDLGIDELIDDPAPEQDEKLTEDL